MMADRDLVWMLAGVGLEHAPHLRREIIARKDTALLWTWRGQALMLAEEITDSIAAREGGEHIPEDPM